MTPGSPFRNVLHKGNPAGCEMSPFVHQKCGMGVGIDTSLPLEWPCHRLDNNGKRGSKDSCWMQPTAINNHHFSRR